MSEGLNIFKFKDVFYFHICKYLGILDLLSFARVSKELYSLSRNDYAWNQNVNYAKKKMQNTLVWIVEKCFVDTNVQNIITSIIK